MTELVHLDARTAKRDEILSIVDRDAAVILDHALTRAQVDAILAELAPFIAATAPFDDDLIGRLTTRTGGLVARSRTARQAVTHPTVLGAVDGFLKRHAERYEKVRTGFSDGALAALRSHSWPGNVRELDHAVERAVLLSRSTTIEPQDLALSSGAPPPPHVTPATEPRNLEEVERAAIKKALADHDGNVGAAAQALGLSRSALYRRIQRYGL